MLSLSYDAARLGKPAKEVLAIILRNLDKKLNCALPPQDSLMAYPGKEFFI